MPVSPTGIRAKPLQGVKTLIAASSTFQTLVGAYGIADAKNYVHIYEADDTSDSTATMPRAIVSMGPEFSYTQIGVGTDMANGSVEVAFEFPAYDSSASLSDQYTTFCNKVGAIIEECQELAGEGNAESESEIQRLTLSAAPAYGYGTFTAPNGSTQIAVNFAANLATEQAAFDSAMTTLSPTVSRPSTTIHQFRFANGAYANTNVSQMSFTPNTTTLPLNDGSAAAATFFNDQDGNGLDPEVYRVVAENSLRRGWVVVSGVVLSYGIASQTVEIAGVNWLVVVTAEEMLLTCQTDLLGHTLTLDGTFMGAAVTGTMSTLLAGNAGTGESYVNAIEWIAAGVPERCQTQQNQGSFFFRDDYLVRWMG